MKYEDATPEELDAINAATEHLKSFMANLDPANDGPTNGAILATEFSSTRKKLEEKFPSSSAVKFFVDEINSLFNQTLAEWMRHEKSN